MTPAGWIFMLLSWAVIIGLMLFSFRILLTADERKPDSASTGRKASN